ncbi:hypothetical protein EDD85DRAFT_923263 [Armillaria nabsnona]|nr:hypothetical protein EDD85DRAFT_923263 [Armillaria nabsnona]
MGDLIVDERPLMVVSLSPNVRDLYRDHVALDHEYAIKLQALTNNAVDKKSKMESSFYLNTAYDGIIQSMTNTAEDHVNVAEVLTPQVVNVLKALGRKLRRRYDMQFFQKLLSDRDRTYAERLKYDEECGEVDLHRQKQIELKIFPYGRAHDNRHAERIARQADQQSNDMLNCKNSYIISIEVLNKIKARFYNDDLPGLEDSRLVERFTKILQHAQALQSNPVIERFLAEANPSKDQDLFSDHNIRPFSAPNDWKFEPCAFFYDTETLNADPMPKVFLQNKLNKSRCKSSDLYMESRHQWVHFGSSECILNAKIEVISAAVRDDLGAQRLHSFKSSSFSIPTTCGYCQTSIWGLSKQGKTCKVCGISVHSRCELKVPADCQQGGASRSSSMLSRKSTSASSRSTIASIVLTKYHFLVPVVLKTPSLSSFVQPAHEEVSYPTARVIFDFKAMLEFELSVTDGATVSVLEPDDGSGWVKVSDTHGSNGLVPATYLLGFNSTDQKGIFPSNYVRCIPLSI